MATKHLDAEKTRRIETPDENTGHFVISETSFLDNALRVAAEHFRGNAEVFRKQGAEGMMNKTTADGLAEQFLLQAAQIEEFTDMLDRSDGLALLNVQPEETLDEKLAEDASGPRI